MPSRLPGRSTRGLGRNARSDRRNHTGRLVEGRHVHSLDLVAARDVREIRIRGPHVALLVLEHQQAYRPVQSGQRIGRDEQRSQWRITEDQQRRGTHGDARVGGELGLIDFDEELDAFVGDILLEAGDGFRHRVRALRGNDAALRHGRPDGLSGNDGGRKRRHRECNHCGASQTVDSRDHERLLLVTMRSLVVEGAVHCLHRDARRSRAAAGSSSIARGRPRVCKVRRRMPTNARDRTTSLENPSSAEHRARRRSAMSTNGTLADRLTHWFAQYLNRPIEGFEPPAAYSADQLRAVLQPGDVLLVEGNLRISSVIKYITQSTWSHVALYVGPRPEEQDNAANDPPVLVEAELSQGVIMSPLSKYRNFHTRICRPISLRPDDRERVVAHALGRVGHDYDLKNVIDLARHRLSRHPVVETLKRGLRAIGSGEPTRTIC